MSNLNEKVQNIMNEIENNISNENEKEFINKKIAELSVAYLDEIQELSKKIENIEQSQNTLENKVNKIETSVNGIENDIYEEDFDFEIICPYCNAEFTADINSKTNKKKIFETTTSNKSIIIIVMILLSLLTIMSIPTFEYAGLGELAITLFLTFNIFIHQ